MSINYSIINDDAIVIVDVSKIELFYQMPNIHIIMLGDHDSDILNFIEELCLQLKKINSNVITYYFPERIIINDLITNINNGQNIYHNIIFINNTDNYYIDKVDIKNFSAVIKKEINIQTFIIQFSDYLDGLDNFATTATNYIDPDIIDDAYMSQLSIILNVPVLKTKIIVNNQEYYIIINLLNKKGYMAIPFCNKIYSIELHYDKNYELDISLQEPSLEYYLYYIKNCLDRAKDIIFSQLYHLQKINQIKSLAFSLKNIDTNKLIESDKIIIDEMVTKYHSTMNKILKLWNSSQIITPAIFHNIYHDIEP